MYIAQLRGVLLFVSMVSLFLCTVFSLFCFNGGGENMELTPSQFEYIVKSFQSLYPFV